MTRIFALTNHKGGVGKSTSATNIALGITAMLRQANVPNTRVLLIDTDSQAHTTLVTTGRNDYGTDNITIIALRPVSVLLLSAEQKRILLARV
jgi:chromosome partitioning protein